MHLAPAQKTLFVSGDRRVHAFVIFSLPLSSTFPG
jgi:hypothetical protein